VLVAGWPGFARRRGELIHPGLLARFGMRSVLSLPLHGVSARGRLFVLDQRRASADDLALGEVMARQVEIVLDDQYAAQKLQLAAAAEERERLARDLHDGVIQSLGGAVLRLETAGRLLIEDPSRVGELLREAQDLLASEQRDLRTMMGSARSTAYDPGLPGNLLAERLAEVVDRIERHWNLVAELEVDFATSSISSATAHAIDRITHEALVNAARHGGAREARVAVRRERDAVLLTIADRGRGFPFRGVYDWAALQARELGPLSLKKRIASAGGSLQISSTEEGARLEVVLPLR
jgi:signal transduction histidine kinase